MNPWIATADALPQDGDSVLFIVEQRCLVLCGVYADCTFKSRWSSHSPGDISEWRRLDIDVTKRIRDDREAAVSAEARATERQVA